MIQSLKERILSVFVYAVLAFIACALATQLLFVGLDLSGNGNTAAQFAKEIMWKLDGSFTKAGIERIQISSVNNYIKIGPLTNNQNLTLGVKNVLEEALQDKGYTIVSNSWDADLVLDVDIIYFDIEKKKYNLSLFHKNKN